ncbi:MAG TPA: AAA family ATPase [Nakamurella sp.]
MTEPDDAVWIAAGGTRVEGSLAAAVTYQERIEQPTLPGTEPLTVVHSAPVDAPAAVPFETASAPVTEPPTTEPPATEPPAVEPVVLPATEAPKPIDNSVAGSSSPALRAMRGRDPEPLPMTSHGPATVLAMCNQKGGVGKTTSTINLGAALAGYGRRVLLVDLDPQGALSAGLGIAAHELDHTIYNLMLEPSTQLTDVLVPTGIEGVDLIPANIDLSAGEVQLINEVGREHTLSRALRPLLHAYDYILIDCQPSLGLLTINALTCAQGVIIPLAAEWFSLRGVHLLVDTIEKVQARINPDLSVAGVLVTMYDGRTVHSREVVGMLDQRFGDTVYDTIITRTVKFPETTVAGEPITSYAPSHPAAQAYRALAREVIAR